MLNRSATAHQDYRTVNETRNGNIRRSETHPIADHGNKRDNANKLRKERSKYFEDQQMEIRLQEIEDNHARQTQEQRQQSLAEDTKKSKH